MDLERYGVFLNTGWGGEIANSKFQISNHNIQLTIENLILRLRSVTSLAANPLSIISLAASEGNNIEPVAERSRSHNTPQFVILKFEFGILRNPRVSFLNLRHVIFNFLLVVFFDNH
jgi:hypothetical protein